MPAGDQRPAAGADPNMRWRASDIERDEVIEQLRAAHAVGRLDAEEFGERTERALRARFRDELSPLLTDLPGPEPVGGKPPGEEAGGRRPWPASGLRLLPLLVVLLVVASMGAVAHGHFPWPLLWAAGLWWFGGGRWATRRPAASRR